MFSHELIGSMSEFTLMRPVFFSLFVLLAITFLTVAVPKWRLMFRHVVPILLLSIIGIMVSAQLLFYEGVLVDELGLSGDPVTFYLFIGIGFFALLNPCVYLWMNQNESRIIKKNHKAGDRFT